MCWLRRGFPATWCNLDAASGRGEPFAWLHDGSGAGGSSRSCAGLGGAFCCCGGAEGAGSLIAAPGCLPCVIDAGNPGMAVAGMGDVLTGVIAALRAQGDSVFDAALFGALLHAAAGDLVARDGGTWFAA